MEKTVGLALQSIFCDSERRAEEHLKTKMYEKQNKQIY
jgi:hypothetical protein